LQAAADGCIHPAAISDDRTDTGATQRLTDGPEPFGIGEWIEEETFAEDVCGGKISRRAGDEDLHGGPAGSSDPDDAMALRNCGLKGEV